MQYIKFTMHSKEHQTGQGSYCHRILAALKQGDILDCDQKKITE